MKIHRFFVGDLELSDDFWLKDDEKFHQWSKVLRLQPGHKVVLFNSQDQEKLYKITEYGSDKSVRVRYAQELPLNTPKSNVYLCFSLLKKDKNDWVLQKGTELGVSRFVPVIADRTEKTGFDEVRARKIVIEAAEQCGRSDIPLVSEPRPLRDVITELSGDSTIFIAEQGHESTIEIDRSKSLAVFIGPEGGWSDVEKQLFLELPVQTINLSQFTLRAETAAITSVVKLASLCACATYS